MDWSKVKKPWFVPGWIWNKGIDMGAEYAKSETRVGKIAELAGEKAGDIMEKAVQGKDPAKVKSVCENCSLAAMLFYRMADALKDGRISAAERAEIAKTLENIIYGFVDQEAIDAKIDEIAGELKR